MIRSLVLALALVATALPVAARDILFVVSLSPLKVRQGSEITLTFTVDLERAASATLMLTLRTDDRGSTAVRGEDYQLLEWRAASSSEPAGWYENEENFEFEVPPGEIAVAFEFLMRTHPDSANDQRKTVVFQAGFSPYDGEPDRATGEFFRGIWLPSSRVITIIPVGFCGRTPLVRDAIIAALPTVDSCLSVTTTHLALLTDDELDLTGGGVREFEAGDFAGLVNLKALEMNFNPSAALPAGIFDDLISLESLQLGFSGFETLPAGLFDHMVLLERLDLQGNELATLPAGLFDPLTRLERLNLQGNALATLPAGLFDSLTLLERLDLGYNELTTVPAGLFGSLTRVTWLRLSSNALGAVPADIFDGLVGLDELWLDDNRLSSLPGFASSTSLTHLELGSNRIASVPANAFRELAALTTLHLDRNRIATLHRDAFSGLGNLTELWLSYNELESLPADVFDPLTALETLELHSNDLAALPAAAFDSLGGLVGLWLHDNRIGNPPAGLFHPLTSLTTLNLRNNRIEHLPVDVFLGLGELEYLWLEDNPGAPFSGLLLEVADVTGGDIEIVESREDDTFTLTVGAGEAQGLRLTIPRTAAAIIRRVTLATLDTAPGGVEGEAIRQEIRAAMGTGPPPMARAASSSQEIFHVDVQGSAPGPLATPVTLCLPYEGSRSSAAGEIPGVYRYVGGRWSLLTGRTSALEGVVCGATRQFSAFAMFLRTPSPDVNGDQIIGKDDALILYYAFALRSELGNGR